MARPPAQQIAGSLAAARVRPGDRLLVGFSGGRDSVALVHWLLELGHGGLVLCHLDHGLRAESEADAQWCARFAAAHGVTFRGERVPVADLAARFGLGIEEAGRAARYRFFGTVAREQGCERVVLAHHADDQVETFLFRLLRGSGPGGLAAMAPVCRRCEGEVTLEVLRPMLGVWRSEVDVFLKDRGLEFREDPSNADLRWTRNRLRHELLPELDRLMERPVRAALWRAAELCRGEAEALEALDPLPEVLPETLKIVELRGLAIGLQRRRIVRWLRQMGVGNVGFDLVEAVLGLVERPLPAKVNLPGGAHVRRRKGAIFIERG